MRSTAGQFTDVFDAVMAGTGIEVVKIPPNRERTPTPSGGYAPPALRSPTEC
jgi:hypothetical protein